MKHYRRGDPETGCFLMMCIAAAIIVAAILWWFLH